LPEPRAAESQGHSRSAQLEARLKTSPLLRFLARDRRSLRLERLEGPVIVTGCRAVLCPGSEEALEDFKVEICAWREKGKVSKKEAKEGETAGMEAIKVKVR